MAALGDEAKMPMALGGGYCEAMDSGEVLLRLRSADLNMAGISGIDMMKTHPPVIVINVATNWATRTVCSALLAPAPDLQDPSTKRAPCALGER